MDGFIITLSLLVLGFVAGRWTERRHYRSIRARENKFLHIPAVTARTLADPRSVAESRLVVGSTAVSVDHYKRFMASFRRIFGGEIRSYASLIDRGRREALLRMKEKCPGAGLFLNCRIETSTIHSGRADAVACVEVMAYSTAVTFKP